ASAGLDGHPQCDVGSTLLLEELLDFQGGGFGERDHRSRSPCLFGASRNARLGQYIGGSPCGDQRAAKSSTRPPLARRRSSGDSAKTAFGVPAAAHTSA